VNAVGIGPFIFASDRLAAVIGIVVFLIVAAILGRRIDGRFVSWANGSVLGGLVVARIGHVVLHWDSFADELWRVLAVWQGGFHPVAGLLGVATVSVLYIRSLKTGVAAAGAVGAGFLVWIVGYQLTQAALGQPPPTIALAQLEGPPMHIGDTQGRPAVVNIWATWCPPCRREMPLLAEAAASRKDVAFLFVNLGENAETIRRYLDAEKLTLDHVLLDQGGQIPRHYRTIGVPVTLFLRADGTVASMHVGEISREALSTKIERIAAKS
jgi:thiol-disulfide isomerase/thioredoxin